MFESHAIQVYSVSCRNPNTVEQKASGAVGFVMLCLFSKSSLSWYFEAATQPKDIHSKSTCFLDPIQQLKASKMDSFEIPVISCDTSRTPFGDNTGWSGR